MVHLLLIGIQLLEAIYSANRLSLVVSLLALGVMDHFVSSQSASTGSNGPFNRDGMYMLK